MSVIGRLRALSTRASVEKNYSCVLQTLHVAADALDYEEGFVCHESGRLAQASCGLMGFHKTFLAVLLSVRYQPIHDTDLVNPHPRTHLSGRILAE